MNILRAILGIVLGYAVIVLITVTTLYAMYSIGGAEFAFKADTWEASLPWSLISIASAALAGLIAGYVCYLISGNSKIVTLFAAIILVVGTVLAIVMTFNEKASDPRPEGLAFFAAGEKAYYPDWVPYTFPLVEFAGILVVSSFAGKKEE